MILIAPQTLTLLESLILLSPDSSKNTLRSWVEKGRVSVGGRVIKKANHLVQKGEEIAVGKRPTFIDQGIEVLYEDKDLVVICKPEGLLSVATDFDKEFTAHTVLKKKFYTQRVYPVHRLDRETSGVMVFAYSEAARDGLKKLFHDHSIQREYAAIVDGIPNETIGKWESFLEEDEAYVVKSSTTGKLAITEYEVISRSSRFSLLKLTLQTGRKNQIRVHCKEAGHPIIGDKKYGSFKNSAGRLCLHARKLGFVHPVTGKNLSFEAPLPESFHSLIK